MNLKDFREEITKSNNSEFLNSVTVSISYPHLKYSAKLTGLGNVYQFVLNQVKGWNKFESLSPILNSSKLFFESIKQEILNTIPYFDETHQNSFSNLWSQTQNKLNQSITNRNESLFLYDAPETLFLIDLFKNNPNYITGAEDYLSQKNINTIQDKDYLSGVIYAYEFKNQDYTDILQRRNHEKKSLSQIRTSFQEHLGEAESHLNDYLKRTQTNLTEHYETLDTLKIDKNKIFDDWFQSTNNEFDTFYSNAQKSITDNEVLYREKLRLDAPADYWKQRGVKLKADGQKFLIWLIVLIVFSANGLFILLFQIPDGMLLKVFDDKVTAIKWSIILVTMLSLLAYGIKILARLTFSSYHLSRDSEEREQLTHFYLALKQDASVSDSDRQLILQSLFSRADSGLLKEDSSPTMPSSIVEKYVNR